MRTLPDTSLCTRCGGAARAASLLARHEPAAVRLTRAEQLVFFMLCNGLSNKRIADRLAISENTVRFHLKKLYAKFGVRSRTHAVAIGSGAMHERSASV